MRLRLQNGSRAAAAVLLLASFLTVSGCRSQADDPATRLLRQLPSGQALYVYLDLGRIRESPSLAPILRNGIGFSSEAGEWAQTAGLDYRADLEAVALSLGTKGTHLAVRGRFDEAAIRRALASAGAACAESLRHGPCKLEPGGSRPALSLLLRADDLLRVSIGKGIADPSEMLEPDFQRLLVQARERLENGAVIWATFEPTQTEQALVHPPAGLGNLRFFARALQKADRGYFYADELPGGKLQVTLKASCADHSQAASVSNLLTGLNRLAVAALESGKGDDPPPGAQVLREARIVNTQTTVVAIWVVDQSTLRAWGGVG
jgi:hypothetical protein